MAKKTSTSTHSPNPNSAMTIAEMEARTLIRLSVMSALSRAIDTLAELAAEDDAVLDMTIGDIIEMSESPLYQPFLSRPATQIAIPGDIDGRIRTALRSGPEEGMLFGELRDAMGIERGTADARALTKRIRTIPKTGNVNATGRHSNKRYQWVGE